MRYSSSDKPTDGQPTQAVSGSWLVLATTYAVIVSGALLLAAAERTLVYAFAVLVACVAHALLIGPDGPAYLGRAASKVLAVGALAFGLWQTQAFNVHFSYGVAHFLMLVQLIKLYGPHHTRDLRLIQVAAIFLALVSSLWALELIYLAPALLAALSLMANLLALQMYAAEPAFGRPRPPVPAKGLQVTPKQFVSAIWLPTTAVFAATFAFFVLLPRFQIYTEAYVGVPQAITGFSENVSLQQVGRLRESNQVALRARFFALEEEEPLPVQLDRILLRGTVLAGYSNGQWIGHMDAMIRGAGGRRQVDTSPSTAEFDDLSVYRLENVDVDTQLILQTITVESQAGHTLFALYRPLGLKGLPSFSNVNKLTHKLHYLKGVKAGELYQALSIVPHFTDAQLRQAGCPRPSAQWEFFWDVPQNIRPVLEDAVAEVERIYAPKADYDRVLAVQSYLMDTERFAYTYDLPDFGTSDPIAAFLTRNRRGSCEQFSTALALILRAWDIPTRLAIGFKNGEYEPATQTYVFRDKDAHAWVEVFFNGLGWVEFDPTPGRDDAAKTAATEVGKLGRWFAQIRTTFMRSRQRARAHWAKNVIGFGKSQQQRLLNSTAVHLAMITADFRSTLRSVWPRRPSFSLLQLALISATALFLVSVLAVVGRWLHRKVRWRPRAARRGRTLRFYEDLLRILRKKGLRRPSHLTPREFADDAAREFARASENATTLGAAVQLVTEFYYRARFGSYPLTEDQQVQVQEALKTLSAERGRVVRRSGPPQSA